MKRSNDLPFSHGIESLHDHRLGQPLLQNQTSPSTGQQLPQLKNGYMKIKTATCCIIFYDQHILLLELTRYLLPATRPILASHLPCWWCLVTPLYFEAPLEKPVLLRRSMATTSSFPIACRCCRSLKYSFTGNWKSAWVRNHRGLCL